MTGPWTSAAGDPELGSSAGGELWHANLKSKGNSTEIVSNTFGMSLTLSVGRKEEDDEDEEEEVVVVVVVVAAAVVVVVEEEEEAEEEQEEEEEDDDDEEDIPAMECEFSHVCPATAEDAASSGERFASHRCDSFHVNSAGQFVIRNALIRDGAEHKAENVARKTSRAIVRRVDRSIAAGKEMGNMVVSPPTISCSGGGPLLFFFSVVDSVSFPFSSASTTLSAAAVSPVLTPLNQGSFSLTGRRDEVASEKRAVPSSPLRKARCWLGAAHGNKLVSPQKKANH